MKRWKPRPYKLAQAISTELCNELMELKQRYIDAEASRKAAIYTSYANSSADWGQ